MKIKPWVSDDARKECAALVRQLRQESNALDETNRPRNITLPPVDRDAWQRRFGKEPSR